MMTSGGAWRRTASWAASRTIGLSRRSNSTASGGSHLSAQPRRALGSGCGVEIVRAGLDLVAIHRRAPQESGFFVGVIGDHLQKQADGFVFVGRELHQQARLVAELGAPIGRRDEFLEPGGGEVAAGQRGAQAFERLGEAAGAEVAVCDDSHRASVRERRARTTPPGVVDGVEGGESGLAGRFGPPAGGDRRPRSCAAGISGRARAPARATRRLRALRPRPMPSSPGRRNRQPGPVSTGTPGATTASASISTS